MVDKAWLLHGAGRALLGAHGATWWNAGALFDLDLANDRGRYDNASFYSVAALLAAIDGSKSGDTYTIAPKAVGDELVANGAFDEDITGWAVSPFEPYQTYETVTWDAGRIKVDRASGGANNQSRFGASVSVTVGKAYLFGGTPGQAHLSGGAQLTLGNYNLGVSSSQGKQTPNQVFTSGVPVSDYCGPGTATMYLGAGTNASAPRTEYWDDFTVREVVPLVGHDYTAIAGSISGTTPAAASGNKVAFQADTNDELNRLRLVWDADKHLRLIVTRNGTDQANLDLGVVDVSTAFEVRFSAAADDFRASLDGNAIVSDTSGGHPALAYLRIGRSFTGETWDGSIGRVTLYSRALADAELVDPLKSFAIWGDSTAKGDHGTEGSRWWELLGASYDPARQVYDGGASGNSTAETLALVEADTAHRKWTTIVMDRPNTGESAETWIANVKSMVAHLKTDRWLVVPPLIDSAAGQPSALNGPIAAVQSALLSDSFFTDHTFDEATQAAYAAALDDDELRDENGLHFNDDGQAVQAGYIEDWLTAKGW